MFAELLRTVAAVLALLGGPPEATALVPSTRDDTAALQARLDAGEDVELPRLADGTRYPLQGGIVVAGGPADGAGRLTIAGNRDPRQRRLRDRRPPDGRDDDGRRRAIEGNNAGSIHFMSVGTGSRLQK